MAPEKARILLDFDLRKEPVEGSLLRDGGRAKPFTGYMQLVTVLEATLGEARQAALSEVESAQHRHSGDLRTPPLDRGGARRH